MNKMKYLFLIASLCFTCMIKAQIEVRPICDEVTEMPTQLSYSGFIIFDEDQNINVSSNIQLRVQVVLDSPTGNFIYTENHNVTATKTGFFSIKIGENNEADFQELITYINDNPASKYYLNVQMREQNSNNYKLIGSKELLTVPYALVASVLGGRGQQGKEGATSDVQGQQGPSGPQGAQGPQGPNGLDGAQGPQGEYGIGRMLMRSTVPTSTNQSQYYIDDGTNTVDGLPHIRHFDGTNWIDL